MSAFLFKAPTGILADVYSRRLSVIIGVALMGIGFVIEGSFPFFGAILLNQVLWGLGYTFTSGATEAWLADEIGEEAAGRVFLRGSQVGQVAGLIAIPLSVALATVSIQLPIVLGGLLFIGLAVFLWLAMPETGFAPTPDDERTSWRQMVETAQAGAQPPPPAGDSGRQSGGRPLQRRLRPAVDTPSARQFHLSGAIRPTADCLVRDHPGGQQPLFDWGHRNRPAPAHHQNRRAAGGADAISGRGDAAGATGPGLGGQLLGSADPPSGYSAQPAAPSARWTAPGLCATQRAAHGLQPSPFPASSTPSVK